MVFSLYCLCEQHAQGENVSHQNDQHQGEYDDIQAAVTTLIGDGFEHDIGNFYLQSQYAT